MHYIIIANNTKADSVSNTPPPKKKSPVLEVVKPFQAKWQKLKIPTKICKATNLIFTIFCEDEKYW